MLILKQAMIDCKISQQALVKASGYSKALVSRALNGDGMPKDEIKFICSVKALIKENASMGEWMEAHNMRFDDLFLSVADANTPAQPSPDLERILCEIAGRAVLAAEGANGMVVQLVRAVNHLRKNMAMFLDHPTTTEINFELHQILTGGKP